MELRRHSCVLPSNAPALQDNSLQDLSIPSRVLQERSSNRQHAYLDFDLSVRKKPIPSLPIESTYSNGLGAYLTAHGIVASQLVDPQKGEAIINHQTAKLWRALQQSEAYRKYRLRQPKESKDQARWPDHMEYAFWRGLVRWDPMGRRKYMHEGKQRGRNELVADSIKQDTGVDRTRKQVSSHIQVLKQILKDQPSILRYISKEDFGSRNRRHTTSDANPIRNRHAMGQSSGLVSKYHDPRQPMQFSWQGCGSLPVPQIFPKDSTTGYSTFTPFSFEMFVRDTSQTPGTRIHTFTRLSERPRRADVRINDARQWRKHYPELAFMTSVFEHCDLIVCDASIQLMTEQLPKAAELAIQFELMSEYPPDEYDSFECRTRFFDDGRLTHQLNESRNPIPESCASFRYNPGTRRLDTVTFGSSFWARRMFYLAKHLRDARSLEDKTERRKIENHVRQNLHSLTATQEIYVTKGDSKPQRVLVLFWRFSQTHNNHGGQTTFCNIIYSPSLTLPIQHQMSTLPDDDGKDTKDICTHPQQYATPPFDLATHQPYPTHSFDLDTLSSMGLDGAFSNTCSAPSMTTDLSTTHSLPSISHSHDASHGDAQKHEDTDMEFTGGKVNINMMLEPPLNLESYGGYGDPHGHHNQTHSQQHQHPRQHSHDHTHENLNLNPLAALTHLDPSASSINAFDDLGIFRPWPSYPELLDRIEGVESVGAGSGAGAGQVLGAHEDAGQHGGGVELWKLQGSFTEDMVVKAEEGLVKDRKSVV